eukprot:1195357-Prorocentrum_minimum.AAC.1
MGLWELTVLDGSAGAGGGAKAGLPIGSLTFADVFGVGCCHLLARASPPGGTGAALVRPRAASLTAGALPFLPRSRSSRRTQMIPPNNRRRQHMTAQDIRRIQHCIDASMHITTGKHTEHVSIRTAARRTNRSLLRLGCDLLSSHPSSAAAAPPPPPPPPPRPRSTTPRSTRPWPRPALRTPSRPWFASRAEYSAQPPRAASSTLSHWALRRGGSRSGRLQAAVQASSSAARSRGLR